MCRISKNFPVYFSKLHDLRTALEIFKSSILLFEERKEVLHLEILTPFFLLLLLLLLLKLKTKLKKEARNYRRKSSNDKKNSKPEDLRLQEIYSEQ